MTYELPISLELAKKIAHEQGYIAITPGFIFNQEIKTARCWKKLMDYTSLLMKELNY
jgi:hypothetical protein